MSNDVLSEIFSRIPKTDQIFNLKKVCKSFHDILDNERFDLTQKQPPKVLDEFVKSGYFTWEIYKNMWAQIHDMNRHYIVERHHKVLLDMVYVQTQTVCIDGQYYHKEDCEDAHNAFRDAFVSRDRLYMILRNTFPHIYVFNRHCDKSFCTCCDGDYIWKDNPRFYSDFSFDAYGEYDYMEEEEYNSYFENNDYYDCYDNRMEKVQKRKFLGKSLKEKKQLYKE